MLLANRPRQKNDSGTYITCNPQFVIRHHPCRTSCATRSLHDTLIPLPKTTFHTVGGFTLLKVVNRHSLLFCVATPDDVYQLYQDEHGCDTVCDMAMNGVISGHTLTPPSHSCDPTPVIPQTSATTALNQPAQMPRLPHSEAPVEAVARRPLCWLR